MPSPEERLRLRRRKLLNLRRSGGGVFGLSYGVSAFGSALGAIPGVQTVPVDPPISPDQFATVTAPDAGTAPSDSTGSGSGTADSGGAAT